MKKLIIAAAVIFTIALSAFAKVNVQSNTVIPAEKAALDKKDFIAQMPLNSPKANLSQADIN